MADRPAFWALAATAVIAAVILRPLDDDAFERFLGPITPLVAIAVAAGAGAVALEVLARRGWCPTRDRIDRRELGTLALVAVGLAGAAIAFDVVVPFDQDMNVAWPGSVLFYPSIAFLAEVALHLVPLAIVASVHDRVADRWTGRRRFGRDRTGRTRTGPGRRAALAGIVTVAAIEAGLQTAVALGGPDRRAALFVAPHLLLVGVVELLGFRRNGFVALATFRLTYYAVWHVVWGALRLGVLF